MVPEQMTCKVGNKTSAIAEDMCTIKKKPNTFYKGKKEDTLKTSWKSARSHPS